MKKIIVALLLLVVAISCVSCGKNNSVDVPDGMKLASGEDDRFYLFVPNGWTVDEAHGGPYAYYSSSDASNIAVNFYISNMTAETTTAPEATETTDANTEASDTNPREKYIDAYWDEFTDGMNTSVSEFTVIDTTETTLDNIYAKQYVYSFKIDNTVYKCRMVVTYPAQDLIFCLTYTSLPDNYEKHITDIDKVIAEFKFNF